MMKQIVLYRCRNCGGTPKFFQDPRVREIVLSCSGQLEVIHVLRAFEDGAAGVCIAHCDPGRCKTLDGAPRAVRRIEYARRLLEEIPLDGGRLQAVRCRKGVSLKKEINGFLKKLVP